MRYTDSMKPSSSPEPVSGPSGFHDECGLFGVYGHGNVTDLIYYGLYALQHRGQQGCGICVSGDGKTSIQKGLSLVGESLPEEKRAHLRGHLGIGHNRYATTGKSTKVRNVQPLLVDYKGGKLAIAHNGNLTNVQTLRKRMEQEGSIFQTTTDSEIVLHLIARSSKPTLPERFAEAVGQVEGALTCLILTEDMIIGYRDPSGVRPLSLGYLDGMYLLASETCAFDLLGAHWIRDVDPGEMVLLTSAGVESRRVSNVGQRAQCMFELVYFSRPDSVVYGEAVNEVRRRLGRALARRHPVSADVVRVKFNPVRSILQGKRVVAVDDSIVRGTTSRKLVQLLFKAGAREVHFRVSSPPVTHPCYYGIDTPRREDLIASGNDIEEIRRYIGATSLGYLTLEDLEMSVTAPGQYCYACWTGKYPIPVPEVSSSVPFDVD